MKNKINPSIFDRSPPEAENQAKAGDSGGGDGSPSVEALSMELDRMRELLEEAEAKSSLLDLAPAPLMAVDREFNVTYINAAAAGMLGKAPGDCTGVKCYSFFRTDHCNTGECRSARAMQEGRTLEGEAVAPLPSGELPLRYTSVPVKNDAGQVVGALEYLVDIRAERTAAREIAELSRAVEEGRLEARAREDGLEGGFRQMVEGANRVLDAVVDPLNVASHYAERMGAGEIPEKIVEEYPGDLSHLKESFNRCIDVLNGLEKEARNVAEAAVEGRLEARADPSGLPGRYARLLEGINETVDSLVGYMEQIPVPFMIIDKDFNIRYMNRTGGEVLGVEAHQLVGQKCYNFFKTEHCQTAQCACAVAMRKGEKETAETVARPAGKELFIEYSGVPLKDRSGAVVGALEIVTDKTRTRRAIEEGQVKVDYLNKIPTPVMVVDRDFNVVFMNPAGATALGRTPENCTGRKCFSLFNTGHCNTPECQVAMAMQRNGIFTSDTVARLPSGELPIRYTGAPLTDENGNIVGGLEYVLDISKEMEITTGVGELAKAAVDGRLDTRADLDKFHGNYRRIVQGVNETLDAVIKPLKVAADYVDRISKGDTPEKITDEYRGDFNEIKDNLNTLIDAMNEITEVAQAIAGGDLTSEIRPRSERDELLKALQEMVHELKRVVAGVQAAAEQVATGSEEISSATQEMSEGATEQSASVEEISSSMEEMNSTVAQNADNASTTASIAEKAANDAREGGEAVKETVSAMKSIAEKISIIEEIARQTNMLALNAAIEAARAGEHGKGFAVVAAEVRKLAERSQTAAKEISGLSGSSVEIAEKAGRLITDIVPGVQKTAELLQEINAASSEQSSGIQQVTQAIQQLDQVVQQNAGAAEEMASTSEELAGQATLLKDTIEFFRIEEERAGGGVRAQHAPPPRPRSSARTEKKTSGDAWGKKGKAPSKAPSKPPVRQGPAPKPRGFSFNMAEGDHEDEEFERY